MKEKVKKEQAISWTPVAIGLLLIVLAVGGFVFWKGSVSFDKPYMAVYLDTGEVYFGKLQYFPRLEMHDVFAIQTVVNPERPDLPTAQIVPLSDSLWGPEKLILNRDKIVFMGKVGDNSDVMKAIVEAKGN